MAYGMKIGRTYVMRDGKMIPIQCGLLKMRPDFMSKAPQSRALKENLSEESTQQSPSEEAKDTKETK